MRLFVMGFCNFLEYIIVGLKKNVVKNIILN